MFADRIICEESLEVGREGFQLMIRINWSRGVYLSCVERVQLSIDGKPVDPTHVRMVVNGSEHKLTDLEDLTDEFWFINDAACLRVHWPERLVADTEYRIDVLVSLRLPYIVTKNGGFLIATDRCSRMLVARKKQSP